MEYEGNDAPSYTRGVVQPNKRPASYDDLLSLPDHVVGEIIGGDLIATPRPTPAHANASSGVGGQLWGPFHRDKGKPGGPGGWWILDEPELHFHGEVLVPDLGGWRRERMPHLPSLPAFELAPDWVCEVLSPSTVAIDRKRKLPIYARERVGHVWLVDPPARTLEVFRLVGDNWVLAAVHGEEECVRIEPFQDVEFDLGRLWT